MFSNKERLYSHKAKKTHLALVGGKTASALFCVLMHVRIVQGVMVS
jgi:hypothetical protein